MLLRTTNIFKKNLIPFYRFSKQLDTKRIEGIRNHSPLTQYDNLNEKTMEHKPYATRVITQPQTNLKFLVQQGGFPGCSDLGVCIKLGTQDQTPQNSGSLQYLKSFVHMSPTFQECVQNYEFLHQTGASFDINYDVMTTYVKGSFFYEDIQIMTDMLLDLAIRQKNMFEDNFQTTMDLSNINELVRRAAFKNQGIGNPSTGRANILTNKNFLAFQQNITPHNTIISMSNMKNPNEVIQMIKSKIQQRYPKFLLRTLPKPVTSKYQGGIERFSSENQFFDFAIALPSVEFKNDKMELYNILRVLLGTASSFSSGGPGKGMHSRCTKNLLNRVACVQKCSFINEHFQNHGLFGLTVGGSHDTANQVIECTLNEFKKLQYLIPEIQLQRSKNILIANIYANIERQSDRLQQMSKHIYSYGKIRLHEFQQKIRAITNQDVKRQMQRIFSLKPTFVLSGNNDSLNRTKKQTFESLQGKLKKKL